MAPRKDQKRVGKLRAVIYIRYSSHKQDDSYSIEYQTEECKRHAERRGHTVVEIYIDAAKTGKKTAGRDAYHKMMDDAASGKFDVIIVFSFSRAFRNTRDALNSNHELHTNHGIYIESVLEPLDMTNPHGKFSSTTLFAMHELQSEITAGHVKAAMYQAAKQGYFIGTTPPLGYELYGTGHFAKGKERKKYRINEEEARFVREAFRMYANGSTLYDVIKMFKANNVRGRKGAVISICSIQKMFRRKLYIGFLEYNIKDHEPISNHYPELQIIDNETWQKVQTRNANNAVPKPRRRNKDHLYTLTGKIYCGKCGKHYFGNSVQSKRIDEPTYYYYICSSKKRTLSCDGKTINKHEVDSFVLATVKKYVLNEKSINMIARKIVSNLDSNPTNTEEKIKQLEKRKNDIIRFESELTIKSLEESISEETFQLLTRNFRAELEEIKTELSRLKSLASNKISVPTIKEYLNNMFMQIDNADQEVLRSIYHKIIESVTVYDDKVVLRLIVSPVLDKMAPGLPSYSLSITHFREKRGYKRRLHK